APGAGRAGPGEADQLDRQAAPGHATAAHAPRGAAPPRHRLESRARELDVEDLFQAEGVAIERERALEVRDADADVREVADPERGHRRDPSPAGEPAASRPRAIAVGSAGAVQIGPLP